MSTINFNQETFSLRDTHGTESIGTRNHLPGRTRVLLLLSALLLALAALASGQSGAPAPSCSNCAVWNERQEPFRIYGNTYYVGPHGLTSILLTSKKGHILLDGALPESAQI